LTNAPGSWYPLLIILLCIQLVIRGASPLRTASNSLKISFGTIPELKKYSAPSCTAIKRWLQKVGYYKLKKPKIIANDWNVLIDASIQMGEKKCLLVVGCRKSSLLKNRALKLEDLEVLSMSIVSTINAKLTTQVLQEVALLVGKIVCICSDRGSEILRGVKDFQLISPTTRHISDTAHRVANFLEATLEKNVIWKKFRELATQSRRKMQNSLVAGALPPSPRTKSRFMNVDTIIKWALAMLFLLDNGVSTPDLDIDELKKYLGWLQEYRTDVEYWNNIVSIGAAARNSVRTENIHMNIIDSFEQSISSIKMGSRELQFADKISSFLLEQSKDMGFGECFIGSTEVLESLFGKIKYMEHEQTAFGFTSLVLAAMATVGLTDDQTIAKAIKSIKQSDIDAWTVKEIGKTVQSQRRKIKANINKLRNKMGQEVSGFLQQKVMGF
jgi:hypothetical protein